MPAGEILPIRDFYDGLAPQYDRELESRPGYVAALNGIIIEQARVHGSTRLLDVGCANGHRLESLLQATGLEGVGVDLSPGMVAEARARGLEAHVLDISVPRIEIPELQPGGFDLVTCLWMLGHLRGHDNYRHALRNIRSLLAPGGVLVMDVNNRYNAADYGWGAVLRNFARDVVRARDAGDFVTTRSVDGQELTMVVHLFRRGEILKLFGEAGLKPLEVRYVRYATGEVDVGHFGGQICIVAQADG